MNTHTEEFSKAIEYYDRILEIDPNNVSAWYNKGGALYSLEKNGNSLIPKKKM
jgi:tetratricopeptide (TPR) repeat protein